MGEPEDPIDTFPPPYRRLQVECGAELYGQMGIDRDDMQGRMRAMRRNFEFFDAPHIAVLCMDKHFGVGVALDVGTWLQSFLTLLASRGIGSCAQAALRQYPDRIREEMEIPENMRILCGISFGYEDESVDANETTQDREPLDTNITYL
jgi:nitroreductase